MLLRYATHASGVVVSATAIFLVPRFIEAKENPQNPYT